MAQGCPDCFSNREKCGKLPECAACEYHDSCRFCAENDERKVNRRLGHVSYERYSFSNEVSDRAPVPSDEPKRPKEDEDVRRVMEFLLDIDNYSAELLSEVLHGNSHSASDLARKFGVSRQAIHRKIVDACTQAPHLRKLFATRLYRCRRLLRDSDRLTKKHNPNQMEFNFDGLS